MKLYEYQAKQIFQKFGIPIPKGFIANTPEEAGEISLKIGGPVILKAQILVGGRGKAGGIKTASNPGEAKKIAGDLIGCTIKGLKVGSILVEEKLRTKEELYLGVVMDASYGGPVIMVSSEGGVNIEEVADNLPEKIASFHPDILRNLWGYESRKILKRIGLSGRKLVAIGNVLCKLYQAFRFSDAELVEINPLIITSDDKIIAADARFNVDDHSMYRHPEFASLRKERFDTSLELEGKKRGVNYVDLDGGVAVLGNGAGLTMALIDMVQLAGIRPACFLDTGGGVSRERMKKAFELLMIKAKSDSKVKGILFNINLQITPAEEAAQGIVDVVGNNGSNLLIAGVIHGTESEKALAILRNTNIKLCSDAKEAIEFLKILK